MKSGKLARLERIKQRAASRTEHRIRMNVDVMAEKDPKVASEFEAIQEDRKVKDARREAARKAREAAEAGEADVAGGEEATSDPATNDTSELEAKLATAEAEAKAAKEAQKAAEKAVKDAEKVAKDEAKAREAAEKRAKEAEAKAEVPAQTDNQEAQNSEENQ